MRRTLGTALAVAVLLVLARLDVSGGEPGPVVVKIHDEKPVFIEPVLPVEPRRRINYEPHGNMQFRLTVDGKTMHLGSIYTSFHFDGQVAQPGQAGRVDPNFARLPKKPGGKERDGVYSVYVWNNKLRITQTLEVVPSRPDKSKPGQPRRLYGVVVRYLVENIDTQPHRFGLRVNMDTFWVDNDGCVFAAPTTHPNQILDGVELTAKKMPDFVQVLQRPNLQAPGEVAHFTFSLGRKLEPPDRVVLTRLGSFIDAWNLRPQPAMGDSAMGMYWDPKEIKPGGRRELAYAYGQSVAGNPENEGKVAVVLGGSFEPGKLFTVTAYVEDPVPGQNLTLDLPPGMERLEGAAVQPVPPISADGHCLVLWKARVQKTGEFQLRVRSSTGTTESKTISITRAPK